MQYGGLLNPLSPLCRDDAVRKTLPTTVTYVLSLDCSELPFKSFVREQRQFRRFLPQDLSMLPPYRIRLDLQIS